MFDQLFRGVVLVPYLGVPLALIAWTLLHLSRGAWIKALVGLAAGAALCFGAFLLFLMNTYCESCADRPVSAREAVAVVAYFIFGLVMPLVLWWTARLGGKK